MFLKLIITFCIFLYAVVVPIMEVNATHVFNPGWAPHMRLHEVWQLITNSTLGFLCLWLTWVEGKLILSTVISSMVTGGFLAAFILRDTYGGSMVHMDGSETTLFGLNLGVLVFGLVVVLLNFILILELLPQKRFTED